MKIEFMGRALPRHMNKPLGRTIPAIDQRFVPIGVLVLLSPPGLGAAEANCLIGPTVGLMLWFGGRQKFYCNSGLSISCTLIDPASHRDILPVGLFQEVLEHFARCKLKSQEYASQQNQPFRVRLSRRRKRVCSCHRAWCILLTETNIQRWGALGNTASM